MIVVCCRERPRHACLPAPPRRQVVTALSNEKYFRVMHIADEIGVADTSLRLADNEIRFQFRLPSAGKMGELMELMKMAVRARCLSARGVCLVPHARIVGHSCSW